MKENTTDTGNTFLGLSAGTGAWGTMIYFTTGSFCPLCLVVTPLLFMGGMIKKIRYLVNKKKAAH
jgi:hypothetical protein